MIPPFLRRCPACGRWSWSRRFAPVEGESRVVECPDCGHRFEVFDDPRLA